MVAVANSTSTASLTDLLRRAQVSIHEIASHLDALATDARVDQVRALGKSMQRRLWELAVDAPAVTVDDIIAPNAGDEVRWSGKNSLPMFTLFEKRFFRHEGGVVGYNFNPGVGWFSGPGYFTTVNAPDRPKEILFDYTRVPSTAPSGWPAVKPNTSGTARLVYGNMHDFCRRVSAATVIGAATRLGKPIDAYFVLTRL